MSFRVVLTQSEQAQLDLYLAFFDIYRTMRASLIRHLRTPDPFKTVELGREHQDLTHVLIAILKFLLFAMHQERLTLDDIATLNADITGDTIDILIFKVLQNPPQSAQPKPLGLRPFNPLEPAYADYDSVLIGAFHTYIRKVYGDDRDSETPVERKAPFDFDDPKD